MTDQETLTALPGASGDADWFSPENSTFGDRLAGAREAAGMARADLARRLGVKVSTLAKWEDDIAEPRANRLQMLSGILGVSLTWLLTAEGSGPDGPAGDDPVQADLKTVLTEMRQVKVDLRQSADRIVVLEKRLRKILEQTG